MSHSPYTPPEAKVDQPTKYRPRLPRFTASLAGALVSNTLVLYYLFTDTGHNFFEIVGILLDASLHIFVLSIVSAIVSLIIPVKRSAFHFFLGAIIGLFIGGVFWNWLLE